MEPVRCNFMLSVLLVPLFFITVVPGVSHSLPRSFDLPVSGAHSNEAVEDEGKEARNTGSGSGNTSVSAMASICLPGEVACAAGDEQSRFSDFEGRSIDTVIVSGNDKTGRRTIIREMASKQGGILKPPVLERDSAYLYGMGYFSRVEVKVEPRGRESCIIRVEVEERPNLFMKYPYPTLDYDFEEGISYGLRWKVKNFRGLGEEISLSFKKRRDIEHGGGASWYVPWFLGRRMTLDVGFFNYRRLEEPQTSDFIKSRSGFRVLYGIPLNRSLVRQVWLSTTINMEDRHSRLSIPGNFNDPAGIFFRQNIVSTGLSLSFDSRNTRLVPTGGFYDRIYLNHVLSVNGLSQRYTFFQFLHRNYISFGKLGTLVLSADIDNRGGDLPAFFEMGIGGESELRGYSGRERGTSRFLGTVQWRKMVFGPRVYRIPKIGSYDLRINLIAFVDSGALASSFEYFKPSLFRSTYGAGIEIISPIQDIIVLELAGDRHGNGGFYFLSGSRF